MDEAKKDLVRSWLSKAMRDLASARKLAGGAEPYLDTAVYHCQQAAEKALKAFLVFHDQRFPKTHDLRSLANLAEPYKEGLATLYDAAERLTPYAVAFRYPETIEIPGKEEFDLAAQAATTILDFIRPALPADVLPRDE